MGKIGTLLIYIALTVQFLLLIHLNFFNGDNASVAATIQSLHQQINSYEVEFAHNNDVIRNLEKTVTSLRLLNQTQVVQNEQLKMNIPSSSKWPEKAPPTQTQTHTPPEGIALLLMTDQPKWFQRRYSLLIQNLLSNLPLTWSVQIFHPDSKQYHAGVELNPGFKRLIESNHPRLHLTKLPPKLVKARKRPIHLMLSSFVWEHTMAEKVLYLDGNHVLCANSPYGVQDFLQYDWIGPPGWGMFKGQAGGGGISLRNSTMMLQLISRELATIPEEKRATAHEKWGRDDEFFVSRMVKSNKLNIKKGLEAPYVFASKEVQGHFSSSRGVASFDAFSVSGTLPGVSWEDRSEVINYCPELKTIFPSLHEPGCFGADVSKTRDKCAASICALKPEKRSC